MAKKYSLSVEKRDLAGKKAKKLRKQGILPANIYGKNIKSTSVQLPLKEFEIVYKQAGETGLVELSLDKKIHPVLIHQVQRDYVSHALIHADFFQVNLKEKVKTMVPVEVVGEAKAVADKIGLLLQILNEVEVEALPTDLPEKLEVNVAHLAAVNDQATVADIKVPTGVTILTGAEETVAKISELISKEAEEQAAAEAAAAAAAKTTEGGEAAPAATETAEAKAPATPTSAKATVGKEETPKKE